VERRTKTETEIRPEAKMPLLLISSQEKNNPLKQFFCAPLEGALKPDTTAVASVFTTLMRRSAQIRIDLI